MSDQRDVQAELAKRVMDSQVEPQKGFGQVKYVGFRSVKWDAGQLVDCDLGDPDSQTEIAIEVETFRRDGGVFVAKRKDMDTRYGVNNWRDIVLASLKALKVAMVLDLEDKWVSYDLRPVKKWDKASKSVIATNFTTFYFTQIFPDQEACEAAYVASTGVRFSESEESTGEPVETNGRPPNDAIERAATTLYNLIGDDHKFENEVAKNPLMMKHFRTAEAALEFVKGGMESEEDTSALPF